MDTPQHKAPGHDAVEPETEETLPDLEVTGRDAADEIVGGATRVQGTVKWVDDSAPPTQPGQPAH